METKLTLSGSIGLVISIITFIVPGKYLSFYIKIIIVLLINIIFLLYYINCIRRNNNKNIKEYFELNKNRDELVKQFEQKNKIIDNLQYVNNNYHELMFMLIQTLNNLLLIKGTDKDYIADLIKLLLTYKKYMEDLKNGK